MSLRTVNQSDNQKVFSRAAVRSRMRMYTRISEKQTYKKR